MRKILKILLILIQIVYWMACIAFDWYTLFATVKVTSLSVFETLLMILGELVLYALGIWLYLITKDDEME